MNTDGLIEKDAAIAAIQAVMDDLPSHEPNICLDMAMRSIAALRATGEPSDAAAEAEPFNTGVGWENLTCDDQHLLAKMIARNIGYRLVPEQTISEAEDAIDRPLASKQDATSGERHTFVISDGHEAVLDADGRATGETRPKHGSADRASFDAGWDMHATMSKPSADPRVKALPPAFITCTSGAPNYYVTIKTETLAEAQRWHDAVLALGERK